MWNLNFIDREEFKKHVANTIKTYDSTLKVLIYDPLIVIL